MKILATILASAALAVAQAPAPPAFDAASIRPAPPGTHASWHLDPTRISITGLNLGSLLRRAYRIELYQLVVPSWMYGDNSFDLTAETSSPVSGDTMLTLLQGLLTQQFQIKDHWQNKPMSAYALVVAPGGFKMKPPPPAGVVYPFHAPGKPARLLPPGATNTVFGANGEITLVANTSLDALALTLGRILARPVQNQTAIPGNYALDITFAAPPPLAQDMVITPDANSATAPALFAALQHQLGLQLQSRNLPIKTLVVESASKAPLGN